jgi:opacity protein-like surface antigen
MKKFLTVVLACTMLFGFSAAASAQGFDAGVKLGYQTLTGDAGDTFDGAVAWGLFGTYSFNPNIALVGSWTYSKHKTGDAADAGTDFLTSLALGTPTLADVRLKMNQFDVNAQYRFPMEKVTPYLLAGVGLDYWKVDWKAIQGAFDASADESFWDFGVNVGGGLDFAVAENIKIGGEIVYSYIFDEFDGGLFNFLGAVSYGFKTGGY